MARTFPPICTLVRVWRFRTPSLPNGTIWACRVALSPV
jgi:hypothetical protein